MIEYRNKVLQGDARETLPTLPAGIAQCCVTSPPYWGLRSYLKPGHPLKALEIGSEKTPELYIQHLLDVFREVRRVLRDDGTMWVNLGDSYFGSGQGFGDTKTTNKNHHGSRERKKPEWADCGLKPKDLLGMPWRVAFALRDDGWFLRSAVVWAKGVSFCKTYSGSVMPESVNGWRWERCRVKVKDHADHETALQARVDEIGGDRARAGLDVRKDRAANDVWSDCPGCAKCEATGGYVLRRGSWRPTSAYEMVFMFAKSETYYGDAEAVKEASLSTWNSKTFERDGTGRTKNEQVGMATRGVDTYHDDQNKTGRNLRNVWTINPQAFKGSHYATFPEALVEPCVKACTSEKGQCPKCGSPWVRVIERGKSCWDARKEAGEPIRKGDAAETIQQTYSAGWGCGKHNAWKAEHPDSTLGWRPSCSCPPAEPVPQIILDPFGGSGTVAQVAYRLGRDFIVCELNEAYLPHIDRRMEREAIPLFSNMEVSDV